MTPDSKISAMTLRILEKSCAKVEPAGAWHWRCAIRNGHVLPLDARLCDGFLALSHSTAHSVPGSAALETIALRNRSLPGGVRLTLDDGANIVVRADLVAFSETALRDRFQWAIDGIHRGAALARSLSRGIFAEPSDDDDADADSGGAAHPADASKLRDVLAETSWSIEESDGECSAALDSAGAPPALFRISSDGLGVSVRLVRCRQPATGPRRALCAYLLALGGVFRMVRPRVIPGAESWEFGLEVQLPSGPGTDELDHALAALSVAHRACFREVLILESDSAARNYLAVRGFAPDDNTQLAKEN